MTHKNCKYDWEKIQKIYDETGVTGRKICEIFDMPKATLDLATSTGRFKPRPQIRIVRAEKCLTCNSLLDKFKEDAHSKFCNRSCSASYNNKNRDTSFHNKLKKIKCVGCSKEEEVKLATNPAKYKCNDCKFGPNGKNCRQCNLALVYRQKIYCSNKCTVASQDHSKLGRLGGAKSVLSQSRRSKNEIYFSELCKQKFLIVKDNEPMFNGWDADVILINEKIGVLWNGIWHYKKVRVQHSVEAVQARDKAKIEQIINCGYKPYVIKDTGSHKKQFVESEFKIFCNWLNTQQINASNNISNF